MIAPGPAGDAVGSCGDAHAIAAAQGVEYEPVRRAVGGVDLGQGLDARLVESQIRGPSAGVHVDENWLVPHRLEELRRRLQVGFRVGLVLGEEPARPPQAQLVQTVDDVAVAALRRGGAPLAAEKGDEPPLIVGGGRLAAGSLPQVQADVVVVPLVRADLQSRHVAGVVEVVTDRAVPAADPALAGVQVAPEDAKGGLLAGDPHRVRHRLQPGAGEDRLDAVDAGAVDLHPGAVGGHLPGGLDGHDTHPVGGHHLRTGTIDEQGITPFVLDAQGQLQLLADQSVRRRQGNQPHGLTRHHGESRHRRQLDPAAAALGVDQEEQLRLRHDEGRGPPLPAGQLHPVAPGQLAGNHLHVDLVVPGHEVAPEGACHPQLDTGLRAGRVHVVRRRGIDRLRGGPVEGPQPDHAQVAPRRDRGLAELELQIQREAVSGPHRVRPVDAAGPVPTAALVKGDAGEVMDVGAVGEAAGQQHAVFNLEATLPGPPAPAPGFPRPCRRSAFRRGSRRGGRGAGLRARCACSGSCAGPR